MTIKFYKVKDPYGCFSNFFKSKFTLYDVEWTNVEAAYQSRKSLDPVIQKQFTELKLPREARDLGQKIEMRKDWDEIKYSVMKECVHEKFFQDPSLAKILLDTKDEELVEDSPVDFFWGCGDDGSGKNNLGKVLMEIRAELKSLGSKPVK